MASRHSIELKSAASNAWRGEDKIIIKMCSVENNIIVLPKLAETSSICAYQTLIGVAQVAHNGASKFQ